MKTLQPFFRNLYYAASTLSRSFHRSRGNSRATAEEEVLVQVEEPLPPSEESKLSEVRNFVFPTADELTSRCDFSCRRLLRVAYNNLSLLRLRTRELAAQVQGEGCEITLHQPVLTVLFLFVESIKTPLFESSVS